MSCSHVWMEIHEQSLLGGSFQIGWECEKCGTKPSKLATTPGFSEGTTGTKVKLVGVHGTRVLNGTGGSCKYQIYDKATKKLTYIE